MKTLKKIILIDDHRMFTDGLKIILQKKIEDCNVFCSNTCSDARTMILDENIDLAIIDINMPGENGIDFISDLKNDGFNIKTIILTSEDNPSVLEKAINTGVDGILLKGGGIDELISAITEITGGRKFYGADIAGKLIQFSLLNEYVDAKLSTRELEVLKYVCAEYSSLEISRIMNISPHTVDTHRKNIMRKTNSRSIIGLYKWASAKGLL